MGADGEAVEEEDDEAEVAAASMMAAAEAMVAAAEASEAAAKAAGDAERALLRSALADADSSCALLQENYRRLEASTAVEAANSASDFVASRRRMERAAESQAARIEELACECELSKCILQSKVRAAASLRSPRWARRLCAACSSRPRDSRPRFSPASSLRRPTQEDQLAALRLLLGR